MKHAVKQGYLEKNFLEDNSFKAGKNTGESFRPFLPEELTSIFSHEIFSEKNIKTKQNEYSGQIPYFKFWLPILGLYTGARENEIAQLRLEDFGFHGEIPYFKVTPSEETSTKNISSIRPVPIHPDLIKIGLMEYINWLKNCRQRFLFPELTGQRSKGQVVSKWFTRFLKSNCGLINDVPYTKIGFHSSLLQKEV